MANNTNRMPFQPHAPYANEVVVEAGQSVHATIALMSSGDVLRLKPGTYTGTTLTVPTGINLRGSGSNTIFQFSVVLQGTASCQGVYIDDGYYIEQNGVKY